MKTDQTWTNDHKSCSTTKFIYCNIWDFLVLGLQLRQQLYVAKSNISTAGLGWLTSRTKFRKKKLKHFFQHEQKFYCRVVLTEFDDVPANLRTKTELKKKQHCLIPVDHNKSFWSLSSINITIWLIKCLPEGFPAIFLDHNIAI